MQIKKKKSEYKSVIDFVLYTYAIMINVVWIMLSNYTDTHSDWYLIVLISNAVNHNHV